MRVFYPARNREEILARLRQGVEALRERLPLREVILFGSCAVGRQTVASDVDVLIIYRGERRTDAFAIAKRQISIPRLEPHVYSETEAAEMADTIHRMVRGGVRVYPSESDTGPASPHQR